ncbi:late embryogenesis abundant protein D-34-like [Heracleum sosnowskyi]|uniref:Late embryogenesis abundant protein D-34-like n=1 Tax=Heracleum sosnowskyi TaxID=360622 RepID=A0AAD8MHH1_9APIA|nr:late embryogenesis abundant protein D-34-like [Heracleum sosnowskyi]
MSQQQPERPKQETPIKYGDVFDVSGELSSHPISPKDAAAMQAEENRVLGKTQKRGPASIMQSAAAVNLQRGVVDEGATIAKDHGVSVSEAEIAGRRIITEAVGGEVVGQYVEPGKVHMAFPAGVLANDAITIGDALENTARTAGDKPVDQSDVAAIQAAEVRASGFAHAGGVTAIAQSVANINSRTMGVDNKIKLGEALGDASTRLEIDKAVTREDAEQVTEAEVRNNPDKLAHPGGVASSIAAAARLNQDLSF